MTSKYRSIFVMPRSVRKNSPVPGWDHINPTPASQERSPAIDALRSLDAQRLSAVPSAFEKSIKD
jgi:hypothetical protein